MAIESCPPKAQCIQNGYGYSPKMVRRALDLNKLTFMRACWPFTRVKFECERRAAKAAFAVKTARKAAIVRAAERASTPEERKEIAERLRQRRLERKQRRNSRNVIDDEGQTGKGSGRIVGRMEEGNGWTEEWGNRTDSKMEPDDPYLGWGVNVDRDYGSSEMEGDSVADENPRRTKTFTQESTFKDSLDDVVQNGDLFDVPPDIAILNAQELDRVLPVLPFAAQADYFSGGAAQSVQRWGTSLALTVVLSKVALLAATSLTWPLWWPWARAANKNMGIRNQVQYGGIWRTKLLEVSTSGRPRPSRNSSAPMYTTMKTTSVLLGDKDGAQTELSLPYDARFNILAPNQAAEVLVLSDSASFDSFRAVKDVYLPESGLWLSEYPFIDRSEFLELSLEIERESAMFGDEYNIRE